MSNFLAVATVTAALRQLLDDAVSRDVSGASATAVRPNAPAGELPDPGVNLFLYQVTPNASWRNADLPTRSGEGGLVQRPRAAIDVHYLLSFYGTESTLEPQRVLGSALRALHEEPVLSRQRIREVIDATPVLSASDLDEEVELVKFTQLPLTLEELSKLWSVFFQAPYVLSVAFHGTVLLIEGTRAPRPALPVRAHNVYVNTFRQPYIERVTSASGAGLPITAASALRIAGLRLRGPGMTVRFGSTVAAPAAGNVSDTRVDVALPPGLRAGVQSVQVIHAALMGAPLAPHSGVESNAAPFVLQPSITASVSGVAPTIEDGSPLVVDGVTLQSATARVVFAPHVGRTQRVKLLLYEFSAPEGRPAHAYAFDAPPANGIVDPDQADSASIDFALKRLFPGSYLVRAQVDGAESALAVDAGGRYSGPTVTI